MTRTTGLQTFIPATYQSVASLSLPMVEECPNSFGTVPKSRFRVLAMDPILQLLVAPQVPQHPVARLEQGLQLLLLWLQLLLV